MDIKNKITSNKIIISDGNGGNHYKTNGERPIFAENGNSIKNNCKGKSGI